MFLWRAQHRSCRGVFRMHLWQGLASKIHALVLVKSNWTYIYIYISLNDSDECHHTFQSFVKCFTFSIIIIFFNLTSQQKDHSAYPVQQRTKYQQSRAWMSPTNMQRDSSTASFMPRSNRLAVQTTRNLHNSTNCAPATHLLWVLLFPCTWACYWFCS